MHSLNLRITNLEQNGRTDKPIIVVVAPEETEAEAFARLGIDRAKLHPDQFVVIIDATVSRTRDPGH